MKTCKSCGKDRPLEEFSIRMSSQDKRGNTCASCKERWKTKSA